VAEYNLLEHTDAWITRPKFRAQRALALYPSEASVVIKDKEGFEHTEGTCLRAAFMRSTGKVTPAPTEARGERIMSVGKTIEQWFIERWKEMGIWVDNNVKFYWPEYNISGELDVILAEPMTGDPFGVECKTFYGYDAAKTIFGSKWKPGFPKINQLLQALVYTYHFRDRLKYFKMVYMDRSDTRHKEFKIEVTEFEGKWWPVVDGKRVTEFSINDVLERYKMLNHYIDNDVMPPRDYELYWDPARVEREKENGNVSKTAYADWKKGKRKLGDWQCRYCPYKNPCWNIDIEEVDVLVSAGEDELKESEDKE
jgi:hypothetical protein